MANFSPLLTFAETLIHSITACNPSTVTWEYSGIANTSMSLVVTNRGVGQTPKSTSNKRYRRRIPPRFGSVSGPDITTVLSTALSPITGSFFWPAVNVPQGWYMFQATIGDKIVSSTIFFVVNGTDMSCLSNNAASSTTVASITATPRSVFSTSISPARTYHIVVPAVIIGTALLIVLAVLLAVLYRRKHQRGQDRSRNGGSAHAESPSLVPARSAHATPTNLPILSVTIPSPAINVTSAFEQPPPRTVIADSTPEFRSDNNCTPAYPSGLSMLYSPSSFAISSLNGDLSPVSPASAGTGTGRNRLYNLQDPAIPQVLWPNNAS